MNKKIWILAALPVILGCQTLLGSRQQDATVVSEQTTQPPDDNYSSDSFVISRVRISNGALLDQLATETEHAKSLGLDPFVEFDAVWCPPCQAINASLEAQDAITLRAFNGIYLIRVDVDEWGWGDNNNFKVDAIPMYYKLDENGLPTGDKVDGGAWNEDIPENFAPVLDAFFHKK